LEKKSHFGNVKIVFKGQTQWDLDKSHLKKIKSKHFIHPQEQICTNTTTTKRNKTLICLMKYRIQLPNVTHTQA
jgi:hypothetical protein